MTCYVCAVLSSTHDMTHLVDPQLDMFAGLVFVIRSIGAARTSETCRRQYEKETLCHCALYSNLSFYLDHKCRVPLERIFAVEVIFPFAAESGTIGLRLNKERQR